MPDLADATLIPGIKLLWRWKLAHYRELAGGYQTELCQCSAFASLFSLIHAAKKWDWCGRPGLSR
jgi:hypothetical protein